MSHPVLCLYSNSKLPKHMEQSGDGLSAVHELCWLCHPLAPFPEWERAEQRVWQTGTGTALCFTPLGPGRCCLCTPAEPTAPQWQMKK